MIKLLQIRILSQSVNPYSCWANRLKNETFNCFIVHPLTIVIWPILDPWPFITMIIIVFILPTLALLLLILLPLLSPKLNLVTNLWCYIWFIISILFSHVFDQPNSTHCNSTKPTYVELDILVGHLAYPADQQVAPQP